MHDPDRGDVLQALQRLGAVGEPLGHGDRRRRRRRGERFEGALGAE